MIWLTVIGVVLWFVVTTLNRIPIPPDVRLYNKGGSVYVCLKSDTRDPYYRDDEWLSWNSRWFIGLRCTLIARKLRFRAGLSGRELDKRGDER